MAKLAQVLTLVAALVATAPLVADPPCDPDDAPKPLKGPELYVQNSNPAPIQTFYGSLLGRLDGKSPGNDTLVGPYYRLSTDQTLPADRLTLGVTFDGAKPQVTCDGVTLKADRIQVDTGGRVNVLTAEGQVMARFDTIDGNRVVLPPGASFNVAPVFRTGPGRRIIGVHLGQVSEAVAYHLGEDAKSIVMITSVMDGYPAQKAGLKKHDVISHIEGRSPASAARLREVLRAKGEGDTVQLRIRRGAQAIEVSVPTAQQAAAQSPFYAYWDPKMTVLNRNQLIYTPTVTHEYFTYRDKNTATAPTNPKKEKRGETRASDDKATLRRIEERLKKVEDLLRQMTKDGRI